MDVTKIINQSSPNSEFSNDIKLAVFAADKLYLASVIMDHNRNVVI